MSKMFRNPFGSLSKGTNDSRRRSEPHDPLESAESSLRRETTKSSGAAVEPQDSGPHMSKAVEGSDDGSQEPLEDNAGSIGLNVIYTPENGHKADIVFVHGLGGTSRHTWSKHKSTKLFWPLTFLPLEPDLCLARIFTFGYNANFRKAGNISASILDFAKELLFDLKYGQDADKNDLGMGNVPLIFVVHSMGGLIVKEAYIQGQNDPKYQAIIKAISAITFLATPHRGTNLAEILNRILQSTFVTNSKQYISELSKNSFTLQKLNEQFRHIAPKLDIVSFYETQPTSIGVKNLRIMVLEKDSSILGYPGETSKALDADHHGICKYESPIDPNYITVRNVLKSLVSKIISANRRHRSDGSQLQRRESLDVKSSLAITQLPDMDFIFFRDQWTEGTSDWILNEKAYLEWFGADELGPYFLWLNGGAGTGKSVLSSFIINTLVEKGVHCQYFFVRSNDRSKRTLSLLLRTIAYQVAQCLPEFSSRILELSEQAIDFNTADPNTIWERVFKSSLFQMHEIPPLYWIIDGLDEADNPRGIVRQLSQIPPSVPIRVLLVSRDTLEIAAAVQKASSTKRVTQMRIEGHLEDIRRYIRQELSMSGTNEYKENIALRVVNASQNIFLWVRFVVDKLNLCHTGDDVELVLRELPVGMEQLYDRMASKVVENPSVRDRKLSAAILRCVICSMRVLTVAELSQALDQDSSGILDLQRSVLDLCGGFVVIDNSGHASVIHETTREYLLSDNIGPLSVDSSAAHEQMFLSCMRCLMTVGLRAKISRKQKIDFLDYAASWWSSHLVSTPLESVQVSNALEKFLTGHWVLVWIEILSINKKLRVLVQASRNLSRYCARHEAEVLGPHQQDAGRNVLPGCSLKSWATDFVNIVGKFGTLLQRDSESIYKQIPPFCPQSSSIYQQFGTSEAKTLSVSGLSMSDWDDSLARLSTGIGTYTASILAAGAQIAILTSTGNTFVYDSSTFEEAVASPIRHKEPVYRIAMNTSGTLIASYGYRTTKVWRVSTGTCQCLAENDESRPRPLAILFTNNDTTILVGRDDRKIQSLDLGQPKAEWEPVAQLDEPELEGHLLNSASHMIFNSDASLVAVAYRGHPAAAWELDGKFHIGHCWRSGHKNVSYGEVIDACWRPHQPELVGLYLEGVVFKWRPYDDACDEFPVTGVSRLELSKDGNLFATGDVHGTVKVYTTSHFKLIYQLSSQDPVLDLTFSPDNRRFYDVRGYYGNAWEPNVLMSFVENTCHGDDYGASETDSLQPSTTSASACHWIDSVTVLASSPTGRVYCYGTEKGLVELRHIQAGKLDTFQASKSFLSIEAMCWSGDGEHLAFSDSSKTIFVLSIHLNHETFDPSMRLKVQLPLKNLTIGHISQMLFNSNSDCVLVYTSTWICTISVLDSSIAHSSGFAASESRWIIHPRDSSLLIGFSGDTIHIMDWSLKILQILQIHSCIPQSMEGGEDIKPNEGRSKVDKILTTHNKQHLLVQMSGVQNSKERVFLIFETSSISASAPDAPTTDGSIKPTSLMPTQLPHDLSSQITLALSFLPNDRLVFMSRNFSICSSQIALHSSSSFAAPADKEEAKNVSFKNPVNLFSLPGDWMSRECLNLCSMWSIEKSFLCPRNGEVAVVRCAALA